MIAGDMNRREFLKTSVGLAAAASGKDDCRVCYN